MSAGLPPMIGIAGYKNVGKTTLVEGLVAELVGRGFRVATVKHAHHEAELDQPGRDSHRHRAAGANEVAVVSSSRWAIISELRGAPEPTLAEIVARLSPSDIVIVEGYKSLDFPKIEVRRGDVPHSPLAGSVPGVIAIASDRPETSGLPGLDLNDYPAIADFVIGHFGLAVPA